MRAQQPAAATHTPTRSYWPTRPEPLPPPLLAFSPLSLSIPARTRAPRQCGGPPLLLLLLLTGTPPPTAHHAFGLLHTYLAESRAPRRSSPLSPKQKAPIAFPSSVLVCARQAAGAGGGGTPVCCRRRRPPTPCLLARCHKSVGLRLCSPYAALAPSPFFCQRRRSHARRPSPSLSRQQLFLRFHGPRSPMALALPRSHTSRSFIIHIGYLLPVAFAFVCCLPLRVQAGLVLLGRLLQAPAPPPRPQIHMPLGDAPTPKPPPSKMTMTTTVLVCAPPPRSFLSSRWLVCVASRAARRGPGPPPLVLGAGAAV